MAKVHLSSHLLREGAHPTLHFSDKSCGARFVPVILDSAPKAPKLSSRTKLKSTFPRFFTLMQERPSPPGATLCKSIKWNCTQSCSLHSLYRLDSTWIIPYANSSQPCPSHPTVSLPATNLGKTINPTHTAPKVLLVSQTPDPCGGPLIKASICQRNSTPLLQVEQMHLPRGLCWN
jgi:hypothetical protein